MAKKLELSKEKFEEIRIMYLLKKMTTKEISRKTGLSNTVVCKNLKKYNIYVNTNYVDKTNFKKGDLQKEINKIKDSLINKEYSFSSFEEDKKSLIAICKITGKTFKDYKNSSGILTNHLSEIFPGFIHPSSFIKREYKIKNNKYWHEQYFDLINYDEPKNEKFKCSYCNWETNDLKNKSGCYTSHLKNEHNISDIINHLKNNPDKSYLFKTISGRQIRRDKTISNKNNFIECEICGEKLSILSNSHLKKHNITQAEYKLKYNIEISSNFFSEKMKPLLAKANENVKNSFISKSQKELSDFLENNNIKTDNSNRKFLNGVELDIINHEKKIGIEYNGLFYHTELGGKKNNTYHLNKTNLCNKKEYYLIHIFEDEWEVKKDIVKSKLKQIFNLNNNLPKIYARKCDIRKISYYEKNNFLEKNHIQGKDNGNIYYGAFFKDKLVSVMSFISKRNMVVKNEENSYELSRFATDINYRVVGMAGKLISYFIKEYNPEHIISFADRRWTLDKDDNLYTKLGFKLTNILRPDYSYYNSKIDKFKRFHKFNFGKKSIKRKYPSVYNDNKTEWEMMQELGFDRIWDCGKFCYELDLRK